MSAPTKAELSARLEAAKEAQRDADAVVASLRSQLAAATVRADRARWAVTEVETALAWRDDLDAARALSPDARALLLELAEASQWSEQADGWQELRSTSLAYEHQGVMMLSVKGRRYAAALTTWGVE